MWIIWGDTEGKPGEEKVKKKETLLVRRLILSFESLPFALACAVFLHLFILEISVSLQVDEPNQEKLGSIRLYLLNWKVNID